MKAQSQVRAYFTPDEKFLLSELVEPFSDINTSGNDNATNLKRENAWNKVMEKYNASDIIKTPRTSRQLKICWKNMLQRAKTTMSDAKRYKRMTGGGIPGPKPDVIAEKVVGIVQNAVLPLDNPYDDDYSHHGEDVEQIEKSFVEISNSSEETKFNESNSSIKMNAKNEESKYKKHKSSTDANVTKTSILEMNMIEYCKVEHEEKMTVFKMEQELLQLKINRQQMKNIHLLTDLKDKGIEITEIESK
jgi:hypothetical protein